MVKSISAEFEAHLALPVTTLATCWIITRTDGEVFRFTTHVEDVKDVDFGIGEGIQTYLASSGYQRSNIQNDAEMSVNNMEVQGVFDNDAIKELELRRGLFDFAEVRIFSFNYEDTSQGVLKMLRGFLGEVVATPDGAFGVELRSLEQVLTKVFAEFYSKDCRADLGDARCRIPLDPDEVARFTTYAVGDFVRVNNSKFTDLTLTNPDAETGDITGWTDDLGGLGVRASDPLPLLGSFYFFGGANAETRSHQDVTVPGGQEIAIDANERKVLLAWHQTSFAGLDTGEMEIEFFDGGMSSLGIKVGAGLTAPAGQVWTPRLLSLSVPALTRTIRIFIHAFRNAGGNNDAYFDEIFLQLEDISTQLASSFDERIYKVITAGVTDIVQPAYNNAVGQTTFDGGFQANGVLTLAANAVNTETVTIDTKVYTFQTSLTNFNGNVLIGATASDSIDNLIAAITLGAGSGTLYAAATTLHPTVTSSAGNGDTMVAQANDPGTAGNLIDTTEGLASGSWRSVTLINGTDGVVFVAEESWTRIAIVSAVDGTEPRRKFTVTELTPNAGGPRGGSPDDWFNGGGLTFETGSNAGRTMEVLNFVADDGITITQDVELFLEMPFDVEVGDELKVYPGCDKRLVTCRDKFDNVINFVGEPVVPGIDYIRTYPDAQ